MRNRFFIFSLIILVHFISCSKKNYSNLPAYNFKSVTGEPDYSNLNYWAAHPYKHNLSDSVPKSIRNSVLYKDSTVDVFFIYPTTLTDKSDTSWNAKIDDANINSKTDYSSILYQASVFNQSCRIFAPRYRQAHYRTFFINEKDASPYFNLAYEDVKNAFEYYLKNYNNGRPIIIASHSQGTLHAKRLLKEYFDGKQLQNKLVVAYIPGLPINVNYLDNIPICNDENSTGCVVSWRTYKRGYIEPNYVAKEHFKAIVVNPISWKTDTSFVASKYSKGGVLLKFNKVIPHLVNANIHNNILWTSKPNIFGKIFFTQKNYHVGDINLFYLDIRENVQKRIGAFWK